MNIKKDKWFLDETPSRTELEGIFILLEAADIPIYGNVRSHEIHGHTYYNHLCNIGGIVDLASERYKELNKDVVTVRHSELIQYLVDYIKNNKYEYT